MNREAIRSFRYRSVTVSESYQVEDNIDFGCTENNVLHFNRLGAREFQCIVLSIYKVRKKFVRAKIVG